MPLTCKSQVSKVVVHARGALVTRRVVPPATLPEGDVDLVLPGVTPLCEPGSVRATVTGEGRAVVFVQAALSVPEAPVRVGKTTEQVRALTSRIARLRAEQEILGARHQQLSALQPSPALRATSLHERPEARAEDALHCSAFLGEEIAALDKRLIALAEELREREREREAAALAEAQQRTAERELQGTPTRQITVRLGGSGPAGEVEVSYVVPAARWWPVYMLRLSDGGKRATWWLEALVAQLSGEDWSGVRVALSTADLIYDARLPELPSLRLSRAQAAPRRGYRPLPPGLSLMFAGYDRHFPRGTTRQAPPPPAPPPPPALLPQQDELEAIEGEAGGWQAPMPMPMPMPMDEETTGNYSRVPGPGGAADGMAPLTFGALFEEAAEGGGDLVKARRSSSLARSSGPPRGALAAPPAQAARRPTPSSASAPMPIVMAAAPAPARAPHAKSVGTGAAPQRAMALGGGGGMDSFDKGESGQSAPEPDLTPSDAWLLFDSLRLGHADDRAHRGRLHLQEDGSEARRQQRALAAIDALAPPLPVVDPRTSRGVFDHRYEADGVADVPSDGQAHRLMIGSAEATPVLRFRTVPREAAEVYREAELRNPFDAPLLAGPVDVYSEGSLLLTAAISRIDRGGTMQVGMGVEERLRIARNVRVEEQSAGMLGGSTLITHAVSLEVSSALGGKVAIEVLEALPVSDDKSVEIERLPGKPEPVLYKQAERGAAVRGGLVFSLEVPAGGKAALEYRYRITIPAKNEIVGGNRRE